MIKRGWRRWEGEGGCHGQKEATSFEERGWHSQGGGSGVGWAGNEGSVAGKMRASVSPHIFPYISPSKLSRSERKTDRSRRLETDDRAERRRPAG